MIWFIRQRNSRDVTIDIKLRTVLCFEYYLYHVYHMYHITHATIKIQIRWYIYISRGLVGMKSSWRFIGNFLTDKTYVLCDISSNEAQFSFSIDDVCNDTESHDNEAVQDKSENLNIVLWLKTLNKWNAFKMSLYVMLILTNVEYI